MQLTLLDLSNLYHSYCYIMSGTYNRWVGGIQGMGSQGFCQEYLEQLAIGQQINFKEEIFRGSPGFPLPSNFNHRNFRHFVEGIIMAYISGKMVVSKPIQLQSVKVYLGKNITILSMKILPSKLIHYMVAMSPGSTACRPRQAQRA